MARYLSKMTVWAVTTGGVPPKPLPFGYHLQDRKVWNLDDPKVVSHFGPAQRTALEAALREQEPPYACCTKEGCGYQTHDELAEYCGGCGSKSMKRVKPKARGFTLIEGAVALAIVGILAAVAIPNFLRFLQRIRGDGTCLRVIEIGACVAPHNQSPQCRVRIEGGQRVTVDSIVMPGDYIRVVDTGRGYLAGGVSGSCNPPRR